MGFTVIDTREHRRIGRKAGFPERRRPALEETSVSEV
jgi:hypothetical protein